MVGLKEKERELIAMIEGNMKHIQSSFIKCLYTYRIGISEDKLNHK